MGAPSFEVVLGESGERVRCLEGENVLRAMERLNRRGIPVGCRGGGCGVCKVRVTQGRYAVQKQSRAHVSLEDEAAGYALACKLLPQTDLELQVVGQMRGALLKLADKNELKGG